MEPVHMARSGAVIHAPWRKGQPQAPYQADFSVRIAHRSPKGTATSTISSGILCSNSPSEPGRDSRKHHIKPISPFERAIEDRIGQDPWSAWLSWRQQQNCLLYLVSRLTLSGMHAIGGQGSFIAKLSGQERRRDMHPTQS